MMTKTQKDLLESRRVKTEKTRSDIGQEFIVEIESVLDTMKPIDMEHAQLRTDLKKTLKDCRNEGERQVVLLHYVAACAEKSEVVNDELTRMGRAGDKFAIAKWARIMGLIKLLNKTGGIQGEDISWTVKAAS